MNTISQIHTVAQNLAATNKQTITRAAAGKWLFPVHQQCVQIVRPGSSATTEWISRRRRRRKTRLVAWSPPLGVDIRGRRDTDSTVTSVHTATDACLPALDTPGDSGTPGECTGCQFSSHDSHTDVGEPPRRANPRRSVETAQKLPLQTTSGVQNESFKTPANETLSERSSPARPGVVRSTRR